MQEKLEWPIFEPITVKADDKIGRYISVQNWLGAWIGVHLTLVENQGWDGH